MRVFVTGAGGQVGSWLVEHGRSRPHEIVPLTRADADVTCPKQVEELAFGPDDVVINCAAYTAVDAAETDAEGAEVLNARAPELLALRCLRSGARLVQLSTDYVFGSVAADPRPWRVDDECVPETVYGRTKRDGERRALAADPRTVVVRTAWVYSGREGDFVGTMRRLAADGVDPRVVDDQLGSPTYASDLAAGLLDLAERLAAEQARPGAILHAAGTGQATWYELAREVFAGVGADPERVSPCTTEEFPRPARRPAYSVLSPEAWESWGLEPLPEWHDGLRRALV
ncbi:dTDP-4-dehydrorhamnose reductase [Tsukamurella sp. 8F]|uniref:dTDP-4-dehydrorhamnose reductase n=1 Tax=unclassified Tsukamurella TaxID=2633480 RepID=UPI0023BA187C|nr:MULTISPECIES: dTDP-4-dehydrorhamnose reductase [unclassified Tsukamurella]MDF0530648.1 dTDP-4-dehydrorhamnose reductase [Tsukamurella sp. 8J]MDF0587849.1 dTDP-4-dehydrorhamnose reductase [Tsukamurella sp. 8F]